VEVAAHVGKNSYEAGWFVRPAGASDRLLQNTAFDGMTRTDSPALPQARAAIKKE